MKLESLPFLFATLKATTVSEPVVFTWIQDSKSRLEVSIETIRFACSKGLDFTGKMFSVFDFSLPRKESRCSDLDSHIPGPHQMFYTDARKELGAPSSSPQGS